MKNKSLKYKWHKGRLVIESTPDKLEASPDAMKWLNAPQLDIQKGLKEGWITHTEKIDNHIIIDYDIPQQLTKEAEKELKKIITIQKIPHTFYTLSQILVVVSFLLIMWGLSLFILFKTSIF